MELARFATVDRAALRWLKESGDGARFTLYAGDSAVATLVWTKGGGSLATATTATESWTLKRAGFLAPQVTVRSAGDPREIARLTAHLRRHEIQVRGAAPYALHHVSHLLPSWRLTSASGAEVLHIEPVAEHRALSGGAVLVGAERDAPELLLMVVLSWYFVVLAWLEDELVEALAPLEGPDAPVRLGWSD